ncbi:DUF4064 domain-containing protein [Macrococcus hajekii]|uniref:DUF4064 domain-containing protein n=1 Tax=Macrococcus hajekii TaxID=198482 RepID=A0A4R6BNN6_9STAP|nr:DUF4064 domain-containing protein [Macrococcus hajekii]TDM03317.1 DUF4064 domain-containing protein [Macrococcus hajekii]GGA97849.1 hypothetical protein GCM10007190_02320 [Macrococcus hajekii]
MARREYTQTVKPVSRIAEKIFGWLAWLSLLGLIGFTLYSLLVSGNDPNFTKEMERQLTENPEMSQIREMMAQNNMTVPEFVSWVMKFAWGVLAYLALPLILGLIGLLTMKKRILSGIMLLLAGLLTAPLFATFILFWIPLFFLIAAILMFARKDKVIKNEDYYHDHDTVSYDRERTAEPVYVDRDENIERERYTYEPNEKAERPADMEPHVTEERTIDHDDTVTYNRSTDDRVKYVDKTVDATEERRQNYNDRMNNRD